MKRIQYWMGACLLSLWPWLAAAADGRGVVLNAPAAGQVVHEGERIEVRWQPVTLPRICLRIVTGGKDHGLINDCRSAGRSGRFSWTVPDGFVTGFGRFETRDAHVVAESPRGEILAIGPAFVLRGREPEATESDEALIRAYYAHLAAGEYRAAHALLNPVGIELVEPTGERLAYPPAADFESWRAGLPEAVRVEIQEIRPLKLPLEGNLGRVVLGIHSYRVRMQDCSLDTACHEETRFVDAVLGADGRRRILMIGSSP